MTTRSHQTTNTRKFPASHAPVQGMFQSRSFAGQSDSTIESQQPDLKTSLMQAERYGHHLSKMQSAGDSASLEKVIQPMMTSGSSSVEAIQMTKSHSHRKRRRQQSPHSHRKGRRRQSRRSYYKEQRMRNPEATANELVQSGFETRGEGALIGKKFANNMGDHSPSIATLNKAPGEDGGIFVSDRNIGGAVREGKVPVSESDLLTHFTFNRPGTRESFSPREQELGDSHHTMLTTLREAGGVGEKEAFNDFDDLLDKTQSSMFGGPVYPGTSEPVRSYIRRANGQPGNITRHSISPFVGQAIINMDLRRKRKI